MYLCLCVCVSVCLCVCVSVCLCVPASVSACVFCLLNTNTHRACCLLPFPLVWRRRPVSKGTTLLLLVKRQITTTRTKTKSPRKRRRPKRKRSTRRKRRKSTRTNTSTRSTKSTSPVNDTAETAGTQSPVLKPQFAAQALGKLALQLHDSKTYVKQCKRNKEFLSPLPLHLLLFVHFVFLFWCIIFDLTCWLFVAHSSSLLLTCCCCCSSSSSSSSPLPLPFPLSAARPLNQPQPIAASLTQPQHRQLLS